MKLEPYHQKLVALSNEEFCENIYGKFECIIDSKDVLLNSNMPPGWRPIFYELLKKILLIQEYPGIDVFFTRIDSTYNTARFYYRVDNCKHENQKIIRNTIDIIVSEYEDRTSFVNVITGEKLKFADWKIGS